MALDWRRQDNLDRSEGWEAKIGNGWVCASRREDRWEIVVLVSDESSDDIAWTKSTFEYTHTVEPLTGIGGEFDLVRPQIEQLVVSEMRRQISRIEQAISEVEGQQ